MDKERIVWGRRAVEELLASGQPVQQVLLADASRPSLRERLQVLCRERALPCRIIPLAKLAELAGSPEHGGVVAVASPVAIWGMEELLKIPLEERKVIFAFDGVENPRNLGMAARSLVAAGVGTVLLPASGSARPDAVFLEASAGVGERLRIVKAAKLADALRLLKTEGYWIFGLCGDASQSLWAHALPRPAVFVMGGEAKGIRPTVRNVLHERLAIPMVAGVESLNVAVATSLVAFELFRREV